MEYFQEILESILQIQEELKASKFIQIPSFIGLLDINDLMVQNLHKLQIQLNLEQLNQILDQLKGVHKIVRDLAKQSKNTNISEKKIQYLSQIENTQILLGEITKSLFQLSKGVMKEQEQQEIQNQISIFNQKLENTKREILELFNQMEERTTEINQKIKENKEQSIESIEYFYDQMIQKTNEANKSLISLLEEEKQKSKIQQQLMHIEQIRQLQDIKEQQEKFRQ